jgi:hypothetical protein
MGGNRNERICVRAEKGVSYIDLMVWRSRLRLRLRQSRSMVWDAQPAEQR